MRMYPGLVNWLLCFGARAREFQGGRKPKGIQELRAERQVLQGLSLEAELAWAVAYLKHEAATVNAFVSARVKFQDTLLTGSGKACIEVLDTLERTFGVSLWSIEQRVAVLALHEGLEAQKSFVNQIRTESKSASVRFFASMWSVRNEMATHFDTFKRELVARIPEWTASQQFANYALFRCVDSWEPSRHNIANILRWEFNSSTIDFYEVFLRIAQRCVSSGSSTAKVVTGAVVAISAAVLDERLLMLQFASTPHPQALSTFPPVDTQLSDARYEGRDVSGIALPTTALEIEDIIAVSLSMADGTREVDELKCTTLQERLIQLFAGVARKGPGFEKSRAGLLHIYTNFTALDIAGCVQLATIDQTVADPPELSWMGIEAYCRASRLHPAFLQYLPEDAKMVYQAVLDFDGTSATVAAEGIRAGIISDRAKVELDPAQQMVLRAQASFTHSLFDSVAQLATVASVGKSSSARALARLVGSALIRSRRSEEAIRFLVSRALYDPASTPMLPIGACYAAIGEDTNFKMAADLSLPILVDLQSRHVSEQTTVLRYRYEDFLSSCNCRRPSDLREIVDELPREQLVYFLRQVCIPRVMQLSLEFPTSRAVSEERLAVCVLLRALDPNNTTVYEAEILEITRQQGISQGVRAVEQSKIWIDQEPIRRWAERHLSEGFRRLIDLQAAGIVSHVDVNQAQLEPISSEQITKAIEVPELPIDEAGTLLRRLVSQFLAHCFMDKPHGLDSFLSIRVRHGVFAGQMRAAPEAEKIITLQREAGSGDYFSSAYWLGKFASGNPEVGLRVDGRIQTFSREYDNLVDKFVKDHFQIQREAKPLGLFRFGYLPTDLLVLQADLHQASSFDVFIDRCFQVFWNSVDASLRDIREHIDNSLQTDLNRLFIDLINDLEAITVEQPHPELSYASRNAHTRATNALEQVKEWFQPARPRAPSTATFQELVDISLQVVRNMDALFDPKLVVSTEDLPVFFQLQKFTDIFIILFDNIRRHCGLGAAPTATIQARMSDRYLHIQVTNAVALDVITLGNEQKLAVIRQKIEQGLFQRAVSTEGGTGLLKIRNILSGEAPDASLIEFGFEDNSFTVRLNIPSFVVAVGGTDEKITAS